MKTYTESKIYDSFTDQNLREISFYMKFCNKDTNFYMNMHSHQGYEIYFFHQGVGNFVIGDNLFPLEGNDLLLIGPLESHKSAPHLEIPFIRTVINFLPDLLDEQERKMYLRLFKSHYNSLHRHIRLSVEKHAEIMVLLEKLYQDYSKRTFGYQLAIRACLKQLLLEIYRVVFSDSSFEQKTVPRQSNPTKIEQVINYVSTHFNESISLSELSDHFYINQYYLCHLFKKATGTSINEFIMQKRIHYAKLELINSYLSVAEIAARYGFCSSSYFGTIFKRYEGMAPRNYRKQFQRPVDLNYSPHAR